MVDKTPKLVLLDIETSPIVGYTWTTFDASVLKILDSSKIISVSWKELHSEETHVKCIADYKGYKKGVVDDKALVTEIWEVLDEADVVIGHHSDAFDLKRLNARFVYHGLGAPSAYTTVDTCTSAKKYFKFDSNSLNNLGLYLGVGEKVSNGGIGLWFKCLEGDKKAWELMKQYNKQDVVLLEQVYLKLRPFMSNHPNLNLVVGGDSVSSCGTCLSMNVQKRGFSVTKTGKKQRLQCGDCGSWSSGPFVRGL